VSKAHNEGDNRYLFGATELVQEQEKGAQRYQIGESLRRIAKRWKKTNGNYPQEGVNAGARTQGGDLMAAGVRLGERHGGKPIHCNMFKGENGAHRETLNKKRKE